MKVWKAARAHEKPGQVVVCKMADWIEQLSTQLPTPLEPYCLFLSGTEMTDAGLKHLRALSNLTQFELGDNKQFTNEAVAELQKT